jgi:Holliday junction resolvasome RuvABC endonuclease subunit
MKAVLAIDPGETSGLAVVTVEAAPYLRMVITRAADVQLPMTDIAQILQSEGAQYEGRRANGFPDIESAVIEDQFLGINPDSLKKLTRNSGRWEEACIANGLDVRFVMPSVWQTAELGKGKRDQLKKMAVEKCRGLWGVELESDAADAALLGRYVALEMFYGRWK